MSEEYWVRSHCGKCKNPNWICEGDMQDCTDPEIEAIKCWCCGHKWWRDPDLAKDYHGDDPDTSMEEYLEDYAEKGKELPTGIYDGG